MIGFYDESGHSASTAYVSIAGFIGDAVAWSSFDAMWTEALRASDAPYLHMREFAHSIGPFDGWAEPRRRALLSSCIGAITQAELVAVGAVLRVNDFNALAPAAREMFVDPFFCCFQEAMRGAGLVSGGFDANALVVYSRQDEMAGKVRQVWEAMQSHSDVGEWLGTLEFRDMRDSPGLQASDLLAYELRHYYERRSTSPEAQPRWPFKSLIEHQRLTLRRSLLKFLPRWYLELQASGEFNRYMNGLISNPRRIAWLAKELSPLPEIGSRDLWQPAQSGSD